MHIRHYLKTALEQMDETKIDEFIDIFEKLLCDLKASDYEEYLIYKYKLHKMIYGNHLTREMADKWVSHMKNKDGTIGGHWTYDQIVNFAGNLNKCDFYAVCNMLYSDQYNPKFDTGTYVSMARDWLNDIDAGDDKALKYYLHIASHD